MLESEPGKVLAKAYDVILNGWELGGGSIRIHDRETQAKVFRLLGMSDEDAKNRFGFFLESLEYGTPPHGGLALGLDRICALLAGETSIREVIPFPKTTQAVDLMCDAPSAVDPRQLRELHIKTRLPKWCLAVIIGSEPQLFVSDIEAASAFYVDKLGFKVVLSYGEPPFWAQVARDGGRLNLRKVSGPVFDSGFRSREGDAVSATLTLNEATPLFLEFQKAGVMFHQTLRTEPWGSRTFIVEDPDGNLIVFAGS